jgi:hypothetical protein
VIYVQPGATYTPILEGAATGLTGTLYVEVINRDTDAIILARTLTGVEAVPTVPGSYRIKDLVAPIVATHGEVVWDTAANIGARTTANTWTEELEVTWSLPVAGATGTVSTLEMMVDRLVAQFDMPQATILSILNERQRDMVIRSKWLLAKAEVATTVADTATYALPSTVSSVQDIVVGDDTTYQGVGLTEIERVTSGTYFAMSGSSTGGALLQLYPTPDETGLSIMSTAVLAPDNQTYATSTALIVPQEVHRHLHAGCRAELYVEAEDRPDLAASQEQVYEQGVLKLRGLARRVKAGVTRVRVYPHDFTF